MYRALEGNIIKSCVNCKQQGPNGCVFSDLEQGVLHTLQKVRCAFIFHPGTLLFQEGDSPRGVFILCSGGVKLSISSSEGRVLFVKKVGAGGMLGLCASISGQPHPLAAETTECSYISFVKRKDFVKLVQQCGDACFRIVEQLSDNCNVMRREASYLSRSASVRLAKLLLENIPENRKAGDREGCPDVSLTHDEIAEKMGTARETVTRLIMELRRCNVIESVRSRVSVRDRKVLQAIAAGRYELDYRSRRPGRADKISRPRMLRPSVGVPLPPVTRAGIVR